MEPNFNRRGMLGRIAAVSAASFGDPLGVTVLGRDEIDDIASQQSNLSGYIERPSLTEPAEEDEESAAHHDEDNDQDDPVSVPSPQPYPARAIPARAGPRADVTIVEPRFKLIFLTVVAFTLLSALGSGGVAFAVEGDLTANQQSVFETLSTVWKMGAGAIVGLLGGKAA